MKRKTPTPIAELGEKIRSATTQKDRVLLWLRSGRTLTRMEAFRDLGIIESPACISRLRQEGYKITTTRFSVRNRFGEACSMARWELHEGQGDLFGGA